MFLGKHEDFIFEGVKSKPGMEKKLVLKSESKQSEKSSSKSKEVHKEHHQAITKYVFIGVVVLVAIALLSNKLDLSSFSKSSTLTTQNPDNSPV